MSEKKYHVVRDLIAQGKTDEEIAAEFKTRKTPISLAYIHDLRRKFQREDVAPLERGLAFIKACGGLDEARQVLDRFESVKPIVALL